MERFQNRPSDNGQESMCQGDTVILQLPDASVPTLCILLSWFVERKLSMMATASWMPASMLRLPSSGLASAVHMLTHTDILLRSILVCGSLRMLFLIARGRSSVDKASEFAVYLSLQQKLPPDDKEVAATLRQVEGTALLAALIQGSDARLCLWRALRGRCCNMAQLAVSFE